MQTLTPIKIIIADDHHLFRKGVKNHLESFPRFRVIAEASDGEELYKLVGELHPDVAIADIQMPKLNGILTTKKIIADYPEMKVLGMSFLDNEFAIVDMLEAGAKGYLCKNMEAEELETAVDAVYANKLYFSVQTRPTLIEAIAKSQYNPFKLHEAFSLSEREIQIIQLTCEEKTTQDIGEILHISPRTVETHKQNLYRRIGVNSIAGLVVYAIRNGLYIVPSYTSKSDN